MGGLEVYTKSQEAFFSVFFSHQSHACTQDNPHNDQKNKAMCLTVRPELS